MSVSRTARDTTRYNKAWVLDVEYSSFGWNGLNAFEPQLVPHNTYMIYFRPMSLSIALTYQSGSNKADTEAKAKQSGEIMDIAPESISREELIVSINGVKSDVVGIHKITEYARGAYMYGYIIQVIKPENDPGGYDRFDKISVELHSKETGESGMSECFVKRTD